MNDSMEDVLAIAVALGDSVPAPHGSTVHVVQLVDAGAGGEEIELLVTSTETAALQHAAASAISWLILRSQPDERTLALKAYSGLGSWEALQDHAAQEAGLVASIQPFTVQTVAADTNADDWAEMLRGSDGAARPGTSAVVAGWRSEYDNTMEVPLGVYGDEGTAVDVATDVLILSLMAANRSFQGEPLFPLRGADAVAAHYEAARAHVAATGLAQVYKDMQREGLPSIPAGAYLSLEPCRVLGPITPVGAAVSAADIADALTRLYPSVLASI